MTAARHAAAEACLALLWLHLVTAGPHGQGGAAFATLLTLPSRLPRRAPEVKPALPKAA